MNLPRQLCVCSSAYLNMRVRVCYYVNGEEE